LGEGKQAYSFYFDVIEYIYRFYLVSVWFNPRYSACWGNYSQQAEYEGDDDMVSTPPTEINPNTPLQIPI